MGRIATVFVLGTVLCVAGLAATVGSAAPPPRWARSDNSDQHRAGRELGYAREKLKEASGYAKINSDMRILATMAQRYLAVAEEHYRSRRYFQAAETAAVSNRLVEAIQHIYWSDAGSRSQGSLPPPSRKPWDRLEGKDHLTPSNLGGAKHWTNAPHATEYEFVGSRRRDISLRLLESFTVSGREGRVLLGARIIPPPAS